MNFTAEELSAMIAAAVAAAIKATLPSHGLTIGEPETFRTILCVGVNGHVWVAQSASFDGHWLHLSTARVVRVWGTTKGLNELVHGKTKDTVLDAIAPVVSVFHNALVAIIPCQDVAWMDDFKS